MSYDKVWAKYKEEKFVAVFLAYVVNRRQIKTV